MWLVRGLSVVCPLGHFILASGEEHAIFLWIFFLYLYERPSALLIGGGVFGVVARPAPRGVENCRSLSRLATFSHEDYF